MKVSCFTVLMLGVYVIEGCHYARDHDDSGKDDGRFRTAMTISKTTTTNDSPQLTEENLLKHLKYHAVHWRVRYCVVDIIINGASRDSYTKKKKIGYSKFNSDLNRLLNYDGCYKNDFKPICETIENSEKNWTQAPERDEYEIASIAGHPKTDNAKKTY